ncbi:hypothetical protein [Streptomyces sp. NPDC058572]|uniref:hypothetical protein n=1 Tax=Streptomyces sp. NPDC058572 TaxID=3346546 RepID=UPI00366664C7
MAHTTVPVAAEVEKTEAPAAGTAKENRRKQEWPERAVRKTARFLYDKRRPLAPLYAVSAMATSGGLLSVPADGWKTAAAMGIGMATTTGVWAKWDGRPLPKYRRKLPTRQDMVWAAAASTTGSGLVTAMAATGGPQFGESSYPGLLTAWAVVFGRYWWLRNRTAPATEAPALTDQMLLWNQYVSAKGADSILPGAELVDVVTTDYGWTGTIVLPRGKGNTWQKAASAAGDIAGVYDLGVQDVMVEPVIGGSARKATIAVFTKHPLRETVPFPGPQVLDDKTGWAAVGTFYDGVPTHYAFWGPDSGPKHSVVYGTTDGGKSRFVDMLLSIERHHPDIVSWVCDPQSGQSLPRWQHNAVDWFAHSAQEGLEMLYAARGVMYERSARYSRMKWTDDKGRELIGRDNFIVGTPDPLLSITIEEAHRVLALPGAVPLVLELVAMARKCGIKFRFVFQGPKASYYGSEDKSTDIRELLHSGNVTIFRTASTTSDTIALNGWDVRPSQLPKYWPDGSKTAGLGYLNGPDDRQAQFRGYFVEDVVHWATTGETTVIEAASVKAAGKVYATRAERAEARLHGEELPLPEAENTTVTGEARPKAVESVEKVMTESMTATAQTGEDILTYLEERGEPAPRALISRDLSVAVGVIGNALTRLKKKGRVVALGSGVWAHPDHTEYDTSSIGEAA